MGCAIGKNNRIDYYPEIDIEYPVIDTNGAGDVLAVGFLSAYLLEEMNITDAILSGQIAARWTCSFKNASSCLISKAQLQSYFEQKRGIIK